MKKLTVVFLFIALGIGAWWALSHKSTVTDAYAVEMSVSRLTCGSCVETIRSAVGALNGVVHVDTDVSSARSLVLFDPGKIDAERIASTITGSGYPATVLFIRNNNGDTVSGIDLNQYVARIGTRLISREYYNQYFEKRLNQAELTGQTVAIRTVMQDAWRSVLQQELLLNAALQFGLSFEENIPGEETTTNDSEMTGHSDRMRESKLIDEYLAMQFPDREPNGIELTNLLNKLYSNTIIDIFDTNLKRKVSSGNSDSGCGGSCCG